MSTIAKSTEGPKDILKDDPKRVITMDVAMNANMEHHELFVARFGTLGDPEYQSLDYVLELSNRYGYDISHWEVETFCKDKKIFTDKRKLNRAFTERYLEERKNICPEHVVKLSEQDAKFLKENAAKLQAYGIEEIKQRIENRRRSVRANYEAFVQELAYLKLEENAISSSRELDYVKAINDAIKTYPDLVYAGMDKKGTLSFHMKRSVLLVERNRAAGLDISVDLGQFTIYFQIGTRYIHAKPYKRNINYNNRFHPHIDSNHRICFGDVHHDVMTALATGDIKKTLGLTLAIINSYNPGNPYVNLVTFYEHVKKTRRAGGVLRSGVSAAGVVTNPTNPPFDRDGCARLLGGLLGVGLRYPFPGSIISWSNGYAARRNTLLGYEWDIYSVAASGGVQQHLLTFTQRYVEHFAYGGSVESWQPVMQTAHQMSQARMNGLRTPENIEF